MASLFRCTLRLLLVLACCPFAAYGEWVQGEASLNFTGADLGGFVGRHVGRAGAVDA